MTGWDEIAAVTKSVPSQRQIKRKILPCILREEVKGYKIRGGVKRRSILP
jgi:hypothetical protein